MQALKDSFWKKYPLAEGLQESKHSMDFPCDCRFCKKTRIVNSIGGVYSFETYREVQDLVIELLGGLHAI